MQLLVRGYGIFGIAKDCMPQPRYAEQTNSFK